MDREVQKPILVLYYDTQWKAGLPRVELPPGFEMTADRSRYARAQVVIFHIPEWKWRPRFMLPRKREGQLWVAWSMECEENYPSLKDSGYMSLFDLTMSYRLDSDVPLLYFMSYGDADEALVKLAAPPSDKTAQAPVAAFISSRINHSKRREYTRELIQHVKTDSFGKYLNNVRAKQDRGRPFKYETIARYKFTLAFENAIGRDYVTEKFYDPLISGSVPVYLGAPNVDEFAPGDHCYIDAKDFAGPRELAGYLNALLDDDAAYYAYFEWKKKPLRPAFLDLTARYRLPGTLRLCNRLEQNL